MNAHKVPATYLDSWKEKGVKNSIYVFYKSNLFIRGVHKKIGM